MVEIYFIYLYKRKEKWLSEHLTLVLTLWLCEDGPRTEKCQINCKYCDRWWHPKYVCLQELVKAIYDKVYDWKFPNCFTFEIKIKIKTEN